MKKDKLLVSLTGRTIFGLKKKLNEIENFGIKRVALFLELYTKTQKKKIYEALLNSNLKEIPFIHARNDMDIGEFKFLIKKFKTKYFNIHEDGFQYLNKWRGLHQKLLLELNYNNQIPKEVELNKIGGFCIDLSHFKASKERATKEYNFVMAKKKCKKLFIANHLNGYSKLFKRDIHHPTSLKQLNYLTTLPKFLFGKYIALEMFNSIKKQLKYKDYAYELIKNKI